MGIFTEVKGEVKMLSCSKLSVEKATKEVFDAYDGCYSWFRQETLSGIRIVYVDFRFCLDGLEASKCVDEYVRSLKEKDKYVSVDLEVTTRFSDRTDK